MDSSTPVDVLFAAAMRTGATWHHLVRDLDQLQVRDEYEDVIGPFAELLKAMSSRLRPQIRRGEFPHGARRDVQDTFALLAALAMPAPSDRQNAEQTLSPGLAQKKGKGKGKGKTKASKIINPYPNPPLPQAAEEKADKEKSTVDYEKNTVDKEKRTVAGESAVDKEKNTVGKESNVVAEETITVDEEMSAAEEESTAAKRHKKTTVADESKRTDDIIAELLRGQVDQQRRSAARTAASEDLATRTRRMAATTAAVLSDLNAKAALL